VAKVVVVMMDYKSCDCNDNGNYYCEGYSKNSSKIIMLSFSVNMSKNGLEFHGNCFCAFGGVSGICGDDGHNEGAHNNLALVINVTIAIFNFANSSHTTKIQYLTNKNLSVC
jgi:hypothetical protein